MSQERLLNWVNNLGNVVQFMRIELSCRFFVALAWNGEVSRKMDQDCTLWKEALKILFIQSKEFAYFSFSVLGITAAA